MAIAGCGSDNDCDNNNQNCVCDSNNNCVPVPTQAAVVVQNPCGVAIKEIHVASVGTTNWGANLITGTLFLPNASVSIAVPCGTYAVELVDNNGHTAIIKSADLCASNANWTIDSATCTVFTPVPPSGGDPASGPAH